MKPIVMILAFLFLPAVGNYGIIDATETKDDSTYSFEFSGETLTQALEKIGMKEDVDLAFDPDLITEDQEIYERIIDKTIAETLTILLENKELDYIILSSGTFVIILSSKIASDYATFSGKVYDNSSGEPVPGATILLADADASAITNEAGHFKLGELKTGSYEIVFSHVGYDPVKKVIQLSDYDNQQEEIALDPKTIHFSPIEVFAHKPLLPTKPIDEIEMEAGQQWQGIDAGRNAIRNLSLFSGVQYGIPMADLHIQGGQSSDHRIFLDGVPVYNPYSFGQLYSAFSPYAIGQISVNKAGFGASQGSLIAGRVNMKHDLRKQSGSHGDIQADMMNTNAKLAFNSEAQNFNIMGAYRRSLLDWIDPPGLYDAIDDWNLVDPLTYNLIVEPDEQPRLFESSANNTDINYQDFHLATSYKIDPYRDLRASFYYGENAIQTDLLADSSLPQDGVQMFSRDRNKWSNTIARLRYDWLATPRLDVNMQASYSANQLEHTYAMFDNPAIQQISQNISGGELFDELAGNIDEAPSQTDYNTIQHFILENQFDYTFSSALSLSSGLKYNYVTSEFDLDGLFYLPSLQEQSSSIISTFINVDWKPTPNLQINTGSRFTYFEPKDNIYAEPRASVQYDRQSELLNYWSVKLSGGVYRQFVNEFQITNVGPSALVPDYSVWYHSGDLDQPTSYNTGLNFLVQPTNSTTIRFDGYTKLQPTAYITSYYNLLLAEDDERSATDAFVESTDKNAWGGGIRINQEMLQGDLQFLLGYDYSWTEINYETQFEKTLPAPWNEPHRLQARILTHITNDLSIMGKWQGIYGRTWAFRQSYYDFLTLHDFTEAGDYSFTSPENDNLPPYNQVDVSIIYQPSMGALNTEFRLELINLLDYRNELDRNLIPVFESQNTEPELSDTEFDIRARKLPGFTPTVSLKIGF